VVCFAYSLIFLGCADDPARAAPAPPATPLEQLAKERSPKAMVRAWGLAGLRGDPDTVKAAYDLTTPNGRATAEAMATMARANRATEKLAGAARRKYGEEAVGVVEKALNAKLGGQTDWKAVQAALDTAKVYFAEDGATAVVRMGGEKQEWTYTEVERKDGRWFITPMKDTSGAERTTALTEVFMVAVFEKAAKLVEQSNSLDEARKSLEELRKALDAAGSEKKTEGDKK